MLSGSQNFLLSEQIGQSLTGRVGILKLMPFSMTELENANLLLGSFELVAFKGFFPRIFDQKIKPDDFYPSYENVFRDGIQEGNNEIIFSIKFLAPDNATPMDQWYGDWLVVSPLQNFVDIYECTDGLPWGVSPLTDVNNPRVNGDSRLGKTIFFDFVEFDGNEHHSSNSRPSGYGLKKFISPGLMPSGYSTLIQQDWVMLRYAEILLIYAEAQNELLSNPDQSVYDAINDIRNRVGMPDIPQGLNQAEMRERIRYERRVELAFEGLRFYDLKRWRIAEEVLNNVDDGILIYNFEKRFYQWPIPQTEIDKSLGILEQNPDYM